MDGPIVQLELFAVMYIYIVIGPLEDGPIVQLDLFAGDTALLECPVTGLPLEPGYQLTWGRRFGMLPLDRINFTCDNQTLILRNTVAPDDIGQYFCQVREPSGRIFIFTISLVLFGNASFPLYIC